MVAVVEWLWWKRGGGGDISFMLGPHSKRASSNRARKVTALDGKFFIMQSFVALIL